MIRRHFRNLNHRNIYPLYTDSIIVQNPVSLVIQPGYILEYIDKISTRTITGLVVIFQDYNNPFKHNNKSAAFDFANYKIILA